MKKVVKFVVIACILVGVMTGMMSGCNTAKDVTPSSKTVSA